jgi:hypothetical protein
MRHPSSAAALAFAAALFAGRAAAQAPLPKDSPFLRPAAAADAAAPANETLVLAGVSGLGKNALVCISDTTIKRSYWIRVGTTVEGIKVLTYDAARDQAVISVGGQEKLLTLRQAAVASAGAGGAAPASFAQPMPAAVGPTQGTPVPPPAPGSVAQQETEARMLVSDLLEIGMQQRKAYEEAQKKAEAAKKKT